LDAAGFVDMENCVMVDEDSVVDKVAALFDDRAELSRITDNGFALVHSRHTASQRDQIRQWYDLRMRADPTQRVRQPGPFADLELVETSGDVSNRYVVNGGRDRLLLVEADKLFGAEKYGEAERLYLRAYNLHFAAEPVLGIARCRLALGDALSALDWVGKTIDRCTIALSGDPDPVEWAYVIRGELCLGNLSRAEALARQHPDMGHPELTRIRTVVSSLAGRSPVEGAAVRRKSLHVLPTQDGAEWLAELRGMVLANGQTQYLSALDCLSTSDLLSGAGGGGSGHRHSIRAPGGEGRVMRARPLHRRLRLKGPARLLRMGSMLPKSPLPEVVSDLVNGVQGAGTRSSNIVVVASSFRDVLRTGVVDAAGVSPSLPRVHWLRKQVPQVVELRQSVGGLGYQRLRSCSLLGARRESVLADIDVLLILDPSIASVLTLEETTTASTILLAEPDTLAGAELQEVLLGTGELTISHVRGAGAGTSYLVVKR
jgi:hypothetical protein